MKTEENGLGTEVTEAVERAGNLLIRAAAAIGRLSKEQQEALNQATRGKLADSLAFALEGAAAVSADVRAAMKAHPPAGFGSVSRQDEEVTWFVDGGAVASVVCTKLVSSGVSFKCGPVEGSTWFAFTMGKKMSALVRPRVAMDRPEWEKQT